MVAKIILGFLCLIAVNAASAQVPKAHKAVQSSLICDAYERISGLDDKKVGKATISIKTEPTLEILINSSVKELNFQIGNGGEPRSLYMFDPVTCSDFYDRGSMGHLRFIHACNEMGQTPHLNQDAPVAKLDYLPANSSGVLCKSYSFGARNECWELKGCQ